VVVETLSRPEGFLGHLMGEEIRVVLLQPLLLNLNGDPAKLKPDP
jgi:hypothetical protein